jgi:hypothetical protein
MTTRSENHSLMFCFFVFLLVLLVACSIWSELKIFGPPRERAQNAKALCRAHGGAVLNRDLSLENVALIPMGPERWCAVSPLKAPRVEGHIQVALAKP